MGFEEIEQVLGSAVVEDVREAVRRAFVASRQVGGETGQVALEELLVAFVAAAVLPPGECALGVERAAGCARRLVEIARMATLAHETQAHQSPLN